jgi:hypothetical protein
MASSSRKRCAVGPPGSPPHRDTSSSSSDRASSSSSTTSPPSPSYVPVLPPVPADAPVGVHPWLVFNTTTRLEREAGRRHEMYRGHVFGEHRTYDRDALEQFGLYRHMISLLTAPWVRLFTVDEVTYREPTLEILSSFTLDTLPVLVGICAYLLGWGVDGSG